MTGTGRLPEERLRQQVAWSVLGRLFSAPPDQRLIDTVRSEELLEEWPIQGSRTRQARAHLLASAASGEDADAIGGDYRRLFFGPDKLPAPPWESVYRDESRLVFGDATIDVRREFASYGVQVPLLDREPDDHISLELEFLAMLLGIADGTGDEAAAAQALDDHDRFVSEHVGRWAPIFFGRVEQHARTDFWAGWGILGADAVAEALGVAEALR